MSGEIADHRKLRRDLPTSLSERAGLAVAPGRLGRFDLQTNPMRNALATVVSAQALKFTNYFKKHTISSRLTVVEVSDVRKACVGGEPGSAHL